MSADVKKYIESAKEWWQGLQKGIGMLQAANAANDAAQVADVADIPEGDYGTAWNFFE